MKYNLYAIVSGSKYLGQVEADTKDEAIEKGFELDTAYVSLCHQCSSECEDPNVSEIVAEEEKP